MKRRIVSMAVAVMLCLSLLSLSAGAAESPYTDLAKGAWSYSAVEYVAEAGLMKGTSETTFAPTVKMTRGMVATVLYRMEKEPAVVYRNVFQDVPDKQWYSAAVTWAYENKIVNGIGDNQFGVEKDISREAFATMLCRYAQYKQVNTDAKQDLAAYTDASSISNWALTAVRWSVAEKLINGTTATTLQPGGSTTREQCAAILTRFCERFFADPIKGTAQYAAYGAVLEDIVANPQNYVTSDENQNIRDARYALVDIDGDGVEELTVIFDEDTAAAVASMHTAVWKYDAATKQAVKIESIGESSFYYGTGYVKCNWSHNQTHGETIWPYWVRKYVPETGTFVPLGSFYCVDKEFPSYDEALDTDKDGVIYYFETEEEGAKALTLEAYKALNDQYCPDAKKRISVKSKLTKANIDALKARHTAE